MSEVRFDAKPIHWVLGVVLAAVLVFQVAGAPIRVSLDFFANPNHIPIYVALDNGYFDEEGIEVDIFVPGNPSDPVKLAAAQAVEIAMTPQINYLISRSEDLPLIAIGFAFVPIKWFSSKVFLEYYF